MVSRRILERLYTMGNDVRSVELRCLTSIGVGGKAAVAEPTSLRVFVETLKFLKDENVPHRILGLGTNVVAQDEDLEILVLRTTKIASIELEGKRIVAEAGASLRNVCQKAFENSLTGLEELCGIPGSVGGAVKMNAGAYGKEIKDVVEWVELFDGERIEKLSPEDLEMTYRNGNIGSRVVLRVSFKLEFGEREVIREKMVHYLRKRLEKQPIFEKSAGSVFKRPRPDFYVGSAIEKLGLKGFRIGGMEISKKHAGFIVNTGGGTFGDFIELVDFIKKRIKDSYGIDLETEVDIWSSHGEPDYRNPQGSLE